MGWYKKFVLFNETFLGQMSKYAIKIKPICFNSTIFNFQTEKENLRRRKRSSMNSSHKIKMIWLPSGCEDELFYHFRAKFYNPIFRLTLQQYRLVRGDKSELIICPRVISCENCEIRHSKKITLTKKILTWYVVGGYREEWYNNFIFWKPRDLDNIMINNPTIVIPFFLNDLPYFLALGLNVDLFVFFLHMA